MKSIVLINPRFDVSYFGFEYALPIIGVKASQPVTCLPLLAALTPPGFEVTIIDENVEPIDFDRCALADIVGVTGMIVQRRRMKEILGALKSRGAFTVVGGPWVTAKEDYFGDLADVVFNGEAEETWPRFLTDWADGAHDRHYQQEGRTDMAKLPVPRYDLLDMKAYAFGNVQISRGCPFTCEFCDIIVMFGRRPRLKAASQVIAELEALVRFGKTHIFIVDDNLIGNKVAIKPILREIVAWQKASGFRVDLMTEASLDLADDRELMQLLADANIRLVFIGIESPNEAALRETRKLQNLRSKGGSMVEKVHRIQSFGIEIWSGMILGFDADDLSIFTAQTAFIREARVTLSMVGALMAIPTTPLYDRLAAEGRLDRSDTPEFGTNVIPAQMSRSELWDGYVDVLRELNDPVAFLDRVDALHQAFGSAMQQARIAHLSAYPWRYFLWRCRTVLEAAGLLARLYGSVRDRNLRRLYLGRVARLIRGRKGLPVIHDFVVHCVLHYHAWRLCRDLEKGAVINSF
jgi:radical SAM superfamily enzyme YgiQ (UPF0313 family)